MQTLISIHSCIFNVVSIKFYRKKLNKNRSGVKACDRCKCGRKQQLETENRKSVLRWRTAILSCHLNSLLFALFTSLFYCMHKMCAPISKMSCIFAASCLLLPYPKSVEPHTAPLHFRCACYKKNCKQNRTNISIHPVRVDTELHKQSNFQSLLVR